MVRIAMAARSLPSKLTSSPRPRNPRPKHPKHPKHPNPRQASSTRNSAAWHQNQLFREARQVTLPRLFLCEWDMRMCIRNCLRRRRKLDRNFRWINIQNWPGSCRNCNRNCITSSAKCDSSLHLKDDRKRTAFRR